MGRATVELGWCSALNLGLGNCGRVRGRAVISLAGGDLEAVV